LSFPEARDYSEHKKIGHIEKNDCWLSPIFIVEPLKEIKQEQLKSARLYINKFDAMSSRNE
jgi:hypothetical protein